MTLFTGKVLLQENTEYSILSFKPGLHAFHKSFVLKLLQFGKQFNKLER